MNRPRSSNSLIFRTDDLMKKGLRPDDDRGFRVRAGFRTDDLMKKGLRQLGVAVADIDGAFEPMT